MTRVWFDEGRESLRLYVTGHACYDNSGKDIVCAAASALGFALLGFLESRDGGFTDVDYSVECGKLEITAPNTAEIAVAYEVAVTGLMQLSRKYPENIQVTIGRPYY